MRKTIWTIIHPYYRHMDLAENTRLYESIIKCVWADPDSFLYYQATAPDMQDLLALSEERKIQLPAYGEEVRLQNVLRSLPDDVCQRIAYLIDTTPGTEQWEVNYYRPPAFNTLYEDARREEQPFSWFVGNAFQTFYDRSLQTAYTDLTGLQNTQAQSLANDSGKLSFLTEQDRAFLTSPVHPQVAKLVKFLSLRETKTDIQGETVFEIDDDVRRSVRVVGAGEYVEACVFVETAGLAIQLGIPLRNITLNTEQPYLHDEIQKKKLYKHPIESLYPRSRLESLLPRFRR